MAGSPALLLLLSLGLCCTTAQQQRNMMEARFLDRNMKHPQQGQRLDLECLHYEKNRHIFWILLDKDGNLHFIVSSTQSYSNTVQEGDKTSTNFEAIWRGNSPRLVVKSFTAQDQGIYFCITNVNQVLHFSSGQPAFFPETGGSSSVIPLCFPVKTTAAPTTTTATTQISLVIKNSSQHGLDAGSCNENNPNSSCEVLLWVRVAGTCLLLLTAISIIIMHHQRRSSP